MAVHTIQHQQGGSRSTVVSEHQFTVGLWCAQHDIDGTQVASTLHRIKPNNWTITVSGPGGTASKERVRIDGLALTEARLIQAVL